MSELKTRKIKIVSDGTRKGTSVIDLESGEEIAMVLSVSLQVSPTSGSTAIITILNPELELTIDAEQRHG